MMPLATTPLIGTLGAAAAAAGLLMSVLYGYLSYRAYQKPDNTPADHLKAGKPPEDSKVLVCIGDSLTHGRVSSNYVSLLAYRLKDRGYEVVNAGVNDELAFNAIRRLDAVVACKPAFVTILIGTNDVRANLSAKQAQWAQKKMKLPQRPDDAFFRSTLIHLCAELKARTQAQIALLSLPPLGEDFSHQAYGRAAHYSRLIKAVAAEQKVAYLPLNETMTAWLESQPALPGVSYDKQRMTMYMAVGWHFLFKRSFDDIAARNGYHLLTDAVHLNSRASKMICSLIEPFIHG